MILWEVAHELVALDGVVTRKHHNTPPVVLGKMTHMVVREILVVPTPALARTMVWAQAELGIRNKGKSILACLVSRTNNCTAVSSPPSQVAMTSVVLVMEEIATQAAAMVAIAAQVDTVTMIPPAKAQRRVIRQWAS